MSNNNTVSNKTGAVALTSLVLAASILVAFAFQPGIAFAQEIERRERVERAADRADETRDVRSGYHSVKGAGVATDQESGENYRSGFRFLVQKVNGTENEYEVKRGLIAISIDGARVYYTIVPDSWNVNLSEDRLKFEASGKVEQGEETFEVSLNGYFAMHTRMGNLWSIHGEMEGRENQYDLHYVGISHGIRPGSIEELQ